MGVLLQFPKTTVAPPVPATEPFHPTHRFRGNLYEFVCMSRDCTDGYEIVTFRSSNKRLWSCTRALFEGIDNAGKPNFVSLRRLLDYTKAPTQATIQ